jgi:hypothetical protein
MALLIWRMALSSPPGVSEADNQQLRALRLCLVEPAQQVVGAGRADGVVDAQQPHCPRARLAHPGMQSKQQQQHPARASGRSPVVTSWGPVLKFSPACRGPA